MVKPGRVLFFIIVLSLVVVGCLPGDVGTSGGGCAGPGEQGWSGFAGNDGIIYLGSMNGSVLAFDPSVRNRGLAFPGEGEWFFTIESPASPGSVCGSACAPSASQKGIYSTPVVSDELVYVGTYSGKVYAFNIVTGALRWVYPREAYEDVGAIVGNLVLAESTIYAGSSNGKVYALDSATGDRKWEFETGDKIWASPAISDGVVYVGSYDGNLYALSGQNGEQLWQLELPAAIASSPAVSGDNIFFGTFDRYLYAVSKVDGKEIWKFEGSNWFWAKPLIGNNVVYAACMDRKVYALDTATGKELWQFFADDEIVASPVLVDSLLAVVSKSGELYLLDADSGELQSTVPIGYSVMAPLYTDGDIVYVHARDRYVYAVDTQAGAIVWKFETDIE